MIPRYSRPEMVSIWTPETKFRIWFEIEAHACDALAELGVIPKEAAKKIWEFGGKAEFDVERIDEIEREVKHDVIAFLTHLSEFVGPEARFVHQGMTSSDVLDTCLNVQLVRAADLLLKDMDGLLAAIKRRAFEYKDTPTIGRSHGIHAEPTTFGLKLAQAYAEFSRCRERLVAARKEVATCAISGAVGTFANIDPHVEEHVAAKLGLEPEPVSTQVIPRDRHAMYFATLGVVASSIERLATEIRHLQRSEVLEAEEYFSEGQKGSSAMPHKRNPVLTENLTGLARLVRGMAIPAMENVALWHERDISHSSVERMIGPDATVTLDFALVRLTGVVDKLLVYPENMQRNLDKLGGLVHSQRVLLALTQKGVSREDSYRLVQRNAMPVWRGEGNFLDLLKADKDVSAKLSAQELEELFRPRLPHEARGHDLHARVRQGSDGGGERQGGGVGSPLRHELLYTRPIDNDVEGPVMLRTAFDGSRRRRIYLFRHGDVSYVDDQGNRVADSTVVPLTQWGREQATMTGKALANIPFDRAVVSSFPRSVETAELILQGRDVAIEQNPAFVEFQGNADYRTAIADLNEIAYSFKDAAVPGARYVGGDSFEEVNARVVAALELVLAEPRWETLALVAHGGINRLVLGWAFGTGLHAFPAIDQNTCCFNVIDVDVHPETNAVVRKMVRAMNVTAYDLAKEGNHLLSLEQIAARLQKKVLA